MRNSLEVHQEKIKSQPRRRFEAVWTVVYPRYNGLPQTFASQDFFLCSPASAEVSSGLQPGLCSMASGSGASWSCSLPLGVKQRPTMI